MLVLWGMAFSLILGVGFANSGGNSRSDRSIAVLDSTTLSLLVASLVFSGLLVIPSSIYAFLDMIGRPVINEHPRRWFLNPTFLIVVFPFVVYAGQWVITHTRSTWIYLPVLHILAVGLPILWLTYLGYQRLPMSSRQRTWGIFNSGLILGPWLAILAEISALLGLFILAMMYLSARPEFATELSTLAQRLMYAPSSPEVIRRILTPFLSRPGLVYLVIALFVVIVPLIEEVCKPVGIWMLIGRRLSPAEGFVAGVVSGAGFALFENLLYSSNPDTWSFMVTARIGTAAMHILTTGLMGWGLALAWREGRYMRLALAYFTAVLIHGLWNGFSIMAAAAEYLTPSVGLYFNSSISTILKSRETAAIAQFVLGFTIIIMLIWFNSLLRGGERLRAEVGAGLPSPLDQI